MRLKMYRRGAAVGAALEHGGKPLAALATPDARRLLEELLEAATPKSLRLAVKVARLLADRGEAVSGVGADTFPFVWPLLKEDKLKAPERDQSSIIAMNTRGTAIPGPAVAEHGIALFARRGSSIRAPQGGVWMDPGNGLSPFLLTAAGNVRHYFFGAVDLVENGDPLHPGDPLAQAADDPVLWYIFDPAESRWLDPVQWARDFGAMELTFVSSPAAPTAPTAPKDGGAGMGVAIALGLFALTAGGLYLASKGR